jgi:sigma-B regulation protein RsbU (phosphoserine phosphatase)
MMDDEFMKDAAASQLSSDRLALLCHLSQTFNSSLDLDEVLNKVMDEVIGAMRAERGFVMLREGDGNLVFRVARGIDQSTIGEPQFQISRSVVDEVAREGKPVLTSDAQQDSRFSDRRSVMILGLRSILCAPLKIKDHTLGVVYVDNRLQKGIFSVHDLEFLNTIASSAAVAIENARLYQVAVEKGRMERELQMALQVQSSLIPGIDPQTPGWEFASCWVPAHEVAGDFYDYIQANDCLGIVIADVVDKGMAAALFMAFSRTILRASITRESSPKEAITEANQLICADSVYGMFLTLVYASIQVDTDDVTYVNAGHNPPYLYCSKEEKLTGLPRTGMLVGVDESTSYDQRSVNLNQGDFILFYTDGVTEAFNASGHTFGDDKLRQAILENREKSAGEIISVLKQTIDDFTLATAPSDDITMLIAKRL